MDSYWHVISCHQRHRCARRLFQKFGGRRTSWLSRRYRASPSHADDGAQIPLGTPFRRPRRIVGRGFFTCAPRRAPNRNSPVAAATGLEAGQAVECLINEPITNRDGMDLYRRPNRRVRILIDSSFTAYGLLDYVRARNLPPIRAYSPRLFS